MYSGTKMRLQSVCFIILIFFACTNSPIFSAFSAALTSSAAIAEKEYPKVINVQEAAERRGKGAFILDVREQNEWKMAHIPKSVLIPLSQLKNRVNELPKDQDIVVVCQSGGRSRIALDFIRMKGFLKSSSMQGGIQLWQQAGYPLEKGK